MFKMDSSTGIVVHLAADKNLMMATLAMNLSLEGSYFCPCRGVHPRTMCSSVLKSCRLLGLLPVPYTIQWSVVPASVRTRRLPHHVFCAQGTPPATLSPPLSPLSDNHAPCECFPCAVGQIDRIHRTMR
ncbi:hypothetical protein L227DRAFT_427968 [Lentinus tigrinus ALCF2SS1-6]|uniref:Uncharacterized protein n=1 Tax=Lentinus tigrinus ALCF2SS1-6 TaxID=1328759 RepID=A0A5C2RNH6_9APHY|nr:hypothetical protein L227DRAFT_62477 [Lentinus tigrinus ALCF2SS1-6]RPD52864.1 hypothetical protein L227DRAFT_427968 [Lentinus tigrinus ALCF2SS1-6]